MRSQSYSLTLKPGEPAGIHTSPSHYHTDRGCVSQLKNRFSELILPRKSNPSTPHCTTEQCVTHCVQNYYTLTSWTSMMQHKLLSWVVLSGCSIPTKVKGSRGYSAHPRKTSNTFKILSEAWCALESLVDSACCRHTKACSAGIWSQESCMSTLIWNQPVPVRLRG